MRKSLSNMLLVIFPILLPLASRAQWSTAGNTGSSSHWLGTNNGFPLSIKTNNTERLNISSTGVFKFNSLSGTGNALLQIGADGSLSRFNFSGTSSQVLTGAGNFTSINTLTGFTFDGTKVTTSYKLGIGVTNPVLKAEIDGSLGVTGTVYATNFIASDASMVQGQLSFTGNMFVNGYDPIAGLRNEVYTSTQPYFIQSAALYNNNTIINHNNTGNVGIGTDSPMAKFHVVGHSRFQGTVRMDSLQLGDSLMLKTGGGYFSMGPVGATAFTHMLPTCIVKGTAQTYHVVKGYYSAWSDGGSVHMGHNGNHALVQSYGDGDAGVLKLNYYCGKDVAVCTGAAGGNVYMTTATTGKVGIGTSTPEEKLQIKTGAYTVNFGNAVYEGLLYGSSYMGFNALRTDTGTWKTDSYDSNNGGAVLYSNVMGDVFISTLANTHTAPGQSGIPDSVILNNTRLYISSDGLVGFGTRCIPVGYKMGVDGRIICEGVKVKYNNTAGCWPDYVFEKGYAPMSLEKLSTYLEQNKHLPGVPSEAEVKQEGIDLVEMNKAMLKALEETQLYIIQLKQENDLIRQELSELRKSIRK